MLNESELVNAVNSRGSKPTPGHEGLPDPPRAIMYTHPWALQEMGTEQVLAELKSCGFDAIQLSFSYHVASFLMPRHPQQRLRVGIPGVINFRPSAAALKRWPLVPPVAPTVKGEDYLPSILGQIATAGLSTLAWVIYLYNHSLASAHPEVAIENAFGDRHPAQLCAADPTVREYVLQLTKEVVSHEPLSGIVAESLTFLPFDYGALNLKAAVAAPQALTRLLSLCFCSHCQAAAQRAGVDVTMLRAEVVKAVNRHMQDMPESLDRNANEPLGLTGEAQSAYEDFHAVRVERVISLQTQVLDLARSRGLRPGTTAGEGQDEYITAAPGHELKTMRGEYRFELFENMGDAELTRAAEQALAHAGEGIPTYALAQLGNFGSRAQLGRVLRGVRRIGVTRFRFYEYSNLNTQQIGWLHDLRDLWLEG